MHGDIILSVEKLNIIANKIIMAAKGRTIVAWGSIRKELLHTLFSEYKILISFEVSIDDNKVNGLDVKSIDEIKDSSDKYFLIKRYGISDDFSQRILRNYGFDRNEIVYFLNTNL